MIGTTVKLGFDGASVMRGFSKIASLGKSAGAAIGRGLFERVGHRSTDALMTLIHAIPDAVKQTADYAGEINDLSKATGTSVSDLSRFYEMLRIGGAETVNAGKMLATFGERLHEAKSVGGAAGESFAKLGLTMDDFSGKSFSESVEMVMKTIGNSTASFEELASIASDLFGGRAGYKMLAMMKNWDDNFSRASMSTKSWGEYLNQNAGAIDTMGDAMERFQQLKMQVASNVFDMVGRLAGGGGGAVDKLFDAIDPEVLRPKFTAFFSWMGRNVEFILQNGGLWKTLGEGLKSATKNIGEWIVTSLSALWEKIQAVAIDAGNKAGEAFKAAVGFANLPSGKDIIGGLRGAVGLSTKTSASDLSIKQIEETNRILADIRSQGNISAWA